MERGVDRKDTQKKQQHLNIGKKKISLEPFKEAINNISTK